MNHFNRFGLWSRSCLLVSQKISSKLHARRFILGSSDCASNVSLSSALLSFSMSQSSTPPVCPHRTSLALFSHWSVVLFKAPSSRVVCVPVHISLPPCLRRFLAASAGRVAHAPLPASGGCFLPPRVVAFHLIALLLRLAACTLAATPAALLSFRTCLRAPPRRLSISPLLWRTWGIKIS